MAVHVTFLPPSYVGDKANLAFGPARSYQAVTVGSATTGAAQDGEFAYIFNAEASPVLIAKGATPDAGATVATAATSASWVIAAGGFAIVEMYTGDKIDTAAIA